MSQTTETTIRPATEDDLPALAAMMRALAAHHGDAATATEAQLRRLLFGTGRAAQALVAIRPGHNKDRPVGFAATTPRVQLHFGQRGTEIALLFVRPEHRGRGIGRALVEAATEAAARDGHAWVTIGTAPANTGAQAAYRAMGMEDMPNGGPRFVRRLPAA